MQESCSYCGLSSDDARSSSSGDTDIVLSWDDNSVAGSPISDYKKGISDDKEGGVSIGGHEHSDDEAVHRRPFASLSGTGPRRRRLLNNSSGSQRGVDLLRYVTACENMHNLRRVTAYLSPMLRVGLMNGVCSGGLGWTVKATQSNTNRHRPSTHGVSGAA